MPTIMPSRRRNSAVTGQVPAGPAHPDMTTAPGPIVGMVLRGAPRRYGIDHFFESLLAGMEDAAGARGASVLLQVAPDAAAERETYRRWHEQSLVVGVVLSNLVEGDDRAGLLEQLGLPAVVLGEYVDAPRTVSIEVDNFSAMEQALRYLTSLGHRRIARVSGPSALLHTRDRSLGFAVAVTALGFVGRVVESDYSTAGGDRATAALLGGDEPPTAIVYDNDLMAVGGLAAAQRLGFDVPGRLSLLAWDDSVACRLARPPLSAMARDVRTMGETALGSLLDLIDGRSAGPVRQAPPPVIVTRATTAAPAGRRRNAG